jgi:deoxyribodipyrimidine photo-lyase
MDSYPYANQSKQIDMNRIPDIRIFSANASPIRTDGEYVVYWMTAFRRTGWNFSLQRAVEWAVKLNKPLIVLEAIRCDYPFACDRLHAVILNGMNDNRQGFQGKPIHYYPFVEEHAAQGKGLISALSARACVVVTDVFPCFFIPKMLRSAADWCRVKMESVDSNGLSPLAAADRVFTTAFSFRRFLQKSMISYLEAFPDPDPLADIRLPMLAALPEDILSKWPIASSKTLAGTPDVLKSLPISHLPEPVSGFIGGQTAGRQVLKTFLSEKMTSYDELRNHPDADASSRLGPYLHFGHISSHQVVTEILKMENGSTDRLNSSLARGQRTGWWHLSDSAEAFLDQIITWRELGFNMCFQRPDEYDRFTSLPGWAQTELNQHAGDLHPHLYTASELENAATHDPLWNAAQIQLVREGRIHNYLRMLWGKKILEWSSSPQEALDTMIYLNNTYALDGRDPNSYSGIFWILGRYDRPWGPSRPIFGKIRYMSSENTRRKLKLKTYLHRYRL